MGDLLLLGAAVALAAVVAYFASGLAGSFVAQAKVNEAGPDGVPPNAGQVLSPARD